MFATINTLAAAHPQSPWTEEALYAGGNYYWVTLDRDRAVEFYQRWWRVSRRGVTRRFANGEWFGPPTLTGSPTWP